MKDSLTFLGHLSLQLLPITLTTIIAFLFLNWVHISLTLHRDVLQIFFSSLLYDLSRYILEGFQCNLNASHLYLVDFSTSELSSSNPFLGSLGFNSDRANDASDLHSAEVGLLGKDAYRFYHIKNASQVLTMQGF